MQQSYIQDCYYPFDRFDLFAGTGTLATEIYGCKVLDRLTQLLLIHLAEYGNFFILFLYSSLNAPENFTGRPRQKRHPG
jgi:hypothetical protein